MQELGDWLDASAIILSCPGPQRRHAAAILPAAGLILPQSLLGCESQLLAFAAHAARTPDLARRLFFAPMPEIFAASRGLDAALRGAGGSPANAVHLRFGGVRAARVLKGVRNAVVLAERAGASPLTASHHPFAAGTVLPAAVRRMFALCPEAIRPSSMGGGAPIPTANLPAALIDADVQAMAGVGGGDLELVCLADFRSDAWAAGGVHATLPAAPESGTVLLAWNMDHPGSIVPDVLRRLARLQDAGAALPRIVLLPFNYIGQTGIIRDLIKHVCEAPGGGGGLLRHVFLARASSPSGIATLRDISRIAWVDGNDPEHWWTLGRLRAVGIATILIDPREGTATPGLRVAADEAAWVEADTRCGVMIVPARLPSLRALPGLLRLTTAHQPSLGAPVSTARRRKRSAAATAA